MGAVTTIQEFFLHSTGGICFSSLTSAKFRHKESVFISKYIDRSTTGKATLEDDLKCYLPHMYTIRVTHIMSDKNKDTGQTFE